MDRGDETMPGVLTAERRPLELVVVPEGPPAEVVEPTVEEVGVPAAPIRATRGELRVNGVIIHGCVLRPSRPVGQLQGEILGELGRALDALPPAAQEPRPSLGYALNEAFQFGGVAMRLTIDREQQTVELRAGAHVFAGQLLEYSSVSHEPFGPLEIDVRFRVANGHVLRVERHAYGTVITHERPVEGRMSGLWGCPIGPIDDCGLHRHAEGMRGWMYSEIAESYAGALAAPARLELAADAVAAAELPVEPESPPVNRRERRAAAAMERRGQRWSRERLREADPRD